MKNNKSINSTGTAAIPNKKNPRHIINNDDVIKMKFLEQSAKYFGVYVEYRPADYRYRDEPVIS
ncbi:MAG: hypothetical protein OQK69_08545 [Gammaproteobacteria bacterium]|nr:hypothetical protein [Gammaproteobacteria bacterium]